MKYLRCLLHSWAPRPGRWCGGHLLWRRAEASRARWFSGSPARDLKPQLPSPGCSPGLRWWCLLPEEGGEEKEKSLFCSETHKQRASLQDTLQQSAPFFMQVSWRHACDAGEVSSGAKQLENTKSCSQTHESVTGPVVGCGARQCDKLYTVHDRQHLHIMTAGSGRIHRSQTHMMFANRHRKKSPDMNFDCERCCGTSDMTLFHNSYSPRWKQSQEVSFPKCTEIMRWLFYCNLFNSNYKKSSV